MPSGRLLTLQMSYNPIYRPQLFLLELLLGILKNTEILFFNPAIKTTSVVFEGMRNENSYFQVEFVFCVLDCIYIYNTLGRTCICEVQGDAFKGKLERYVRIAHTYFGFRGIPFYKEKEKKTREQITI